MFPDEVLLRPPIMYSILSVKAVNNIDNNIFITNKYYCNFYNVFLVLEGDSLLNCPFPSNEYNLRMCVQSCVAISLLTDSFKPFPVVIVCAASVIGEARGEGG